MLAPLAPAAVAAMIGVVVDRHAIAPPTSAWVAAGLAAFAVVALALWRRRERPATLALLLGMAAIGAAWHHARWSDRPGDDLSRLDWSAGRPAWVRGVLVEVPTYRPGSLARDEGRTAAVLALTARSDGRDWHDASGRVQLTIPGDRTDLEMGQAVEAAGRLEAIAGPLNPGEFDRRDWLRADGIRLHLAVGGASSIWADPGHPDWPLQRRLGRARESSRQRLVVGLDAEVASLASALLLGRREGVDPDDNDAFARTGTMHLLAISGLHLQAMAFALWATFRILGVPRRASFLLVALATLGYGTLVGWMPSVVRSAAMTCAVCVAGWIDRECRPSHSLALAAIFTLGANPAFLFDVGCQLSFLGVAAIVWGVRPIQDRLGPAIAQPFSPFASTAVPPSAALGTLDAVERFYEPRWKKGIRWAWAHLVLLVVASTVAWVVTTPLVARSFHVVPCIGILWNVPLIPLTSVALIAAALAMAPPPLSVPAVWICSKSLWLTKVCVHGGAAIPGAYWYVPGPPVVWLAGFYGLVAVWLWRPSARRPATLGLVVWTLGLLGWGCLPPRLPAPEADVLAVGHGLAMIVEGTDGRTIVYDCGKMGDPRVGRRVIAPALWARGRRRIDAVYLSHADADHFNGLPDLMERFAIGAVCVPPGFGGPGNPDALALLDAIRAAGIPVRTVADGETDEIGGLALRVLHPPVDWQPAAPDNARSLVLDIESLGRRVLLTGDLDGPGLRRVGQLPESDHDVVLAPHHGGRTANPGSFYQWARPANVVVSAAHPTSGNMEALSRAIPDGVPEFRTYRDGAIALCWSLEGIQVRRFLDAAPAAVGLVDGVYWSAFAAGFVAGLMLVGLASILVLVPRFLVRPRPPRSNFEPDPPAWESLVATSADGVPLHAAWRSAGESSRGTVVLIHGIGEIGAALRERGETVGPLGWDVLRPDSRGFGASGAALVTHGGREAGDIRAWLDILPRSSGPIVLWGRSMGAAIALRVAASDPRVAALILEAPYADLRESVAVGLRRRRLPGLLARPIVWRAGRLAGIPIARPSPIELAPSIRVPVLLIHGHDDAVVPLAEAHRLAAAFPNSSTYVEVPGARHSDVFDVGGEALREPIRQFLAGVAPG